MTIKGNKNTQKIYTTSSIMGEWWQFDATLDAAKVTLEAVSCFST